ncbi:Rieske (2Fe-2S) protein [Nesterenkonia alba]|uniref:Rieske (2Fe-2S) protein n=1 Tax=Nesterenkonia alba TaxID=515814 RepID=UPI000405BBE3|nr:Rieske (2Fe-2S) protein [Nesterenkonia alba]
MKPTTTPCRRRTFLGGCAAASAVTLTACAGADEESEPSQWVEVLDAESLAVGASEQVQVGEEYFLLHRVSDAEVRAFSAVCTHQGCTVGVDEDRGTFRCPCHGSEYNLVTGQVEVRPAEDPLDAVEAEISEGVIRLYL